MISQSLRKLSQGLTRERQLAGKNYFSDPGFLGAYLLYFWPISYIQARYSLKTLTKLPQRVLELGAGAGPLGVACFDLGIPAVTFADRSQPALALARQLMLRQNKTTSFQSWNPYHPDSTIKGKFDLICLQHVLNELWPHEKKRLDKLSQLIHYLTKYLYPNGSLLFIEPALTPTSRTLLKLRDQLISQGLNLISPCLHQAACPALIKKTDSCHMDLPWSAPALIKALLKQAGFKKRKLKMTYFIFSKTSTKSRTNQFQNRFLIVSEPIISKNKRYRLIGCGPAGRVGIALHPDAVSQTNRVFLSLQRGDIIELKNAKKIEKGFSLSADSQVNILQEV